MEDEPTTANMPLPGFLRRFVGPSLFLPILVSFTLPWLSFQVGCSETTAPQTGLELLGAHTVTIDAESEYMTGPGGEVVRGTIDLPAQWALHVTLLLVVLGTGLFWLPPKAGRRLRAVVAAVGLVVTAGFCVSAFSEFPMTGTREHMDGGAELGAILAAAGFAVAAFVNLTLTPTFPSGSFKSVFGYILLCLFCAGLLLWFAFMAMVGPSPSFFVSTA